MWKGDKVGYRGLHRWVAQNYGKPSTCENCLKTDLFGHLIHWANVSGNYLRDREDWVRLCASCHSLLYKKTGASNKIRKIQK